MFLFLMYNQSVRQRSNYRDQHLANEHCVRDCVTNVSESESKQMEIFRMILHDGRCTLRSRRSAEVERFRDHTDESSPFLYSRASSLNCPCSFKRPSCFALWQQISNIPPYHNRQFRPVLDCIRLNTDNANQNPIKDIIVYCNSSSWFLPSFWFSSFFSLLPTFPTKVQSKFLLQFLCKTNNDIWWYGTHYYTVTFKTILRMKKCTSFCRCS